MRNNFKDTWILTKANFINLYGLHSIKSLFNSKNSNSMKNIGYIILAIILPPMTYRFYYSIAMAIYETQGAEGLYLLIYLSIFTVFSYTIGMCSYKATSFLFSFKDFNKLSSFPVNMVSVLWSRIILLYISNLGINFVLGFPAILVFGSVANVSLTYYVYATILFFLFPIVPLILGSIVAFIVTKIASKFKNTNIFMIIGSLLFVLISIYLTTLTQSMIDGGDLYPLQSLAIIMGHYFPATFFIRSLADQSFLWFLISVIFNLAILAIFAYLFSSNFKKLNSALLETSRTSNYKVKELEISSQLKALYRKELRTFTSSHTYFINGSMGMFLFTMLSIYTIIFGVFDGLDWATTFILAMLAVGITCTTNSSFSIEGKNFYILKAFPINFQSLVIAKVLLNLTISVPLILLNSILLSVVFDLSTLDFIFTVLILSSLSLLIALNGLIINLFFPKLTFKSHVEIVKQSTSVFLSIIISTLNFLLMMFIHFAFGEAVLISVIFALVAMHWVFIKKVGAKLFNAI